MLSRRRGRSERGGGVLQYGFVIDQTTCIGCHACTVACKTEHDVPLGVNRTWVKYIEKGRWPDTRRFFSVMRCNHCTDAPCVSICPTGALFRREDGIVDFDTGLCIGCKSCLQACPYDALYIDPNDHTAQKCNYCVHRVEVGLEPACVVVCPEGAIISGDVDDPTTPIARLIAAENLSQRSVEQGTGPNLWYRGAEKAGIDPLGAVDPGDGGIWRDPSPSFMSVDLTPGTGSDRPPLPDGVPRVVYNADHPMPWGWRVSSYFLTKGISAGVAIVVALALLFGADESTGFVRWGAPLISEVFLLLTGILLVADLKRPERFYFLVTKGRRESWLVKGAWILAVQAALLGIWLLFGLAEVDYLPVFVWAAGLAGLGVAGYTAFLFGQAEGRDLWQSPALLWHMLAGAVAAGGAAGLVCYGLFGLDLHMRDVFARAFVGGVAALGLIALGEAVSKHGTANRAAAVYHLTRGAYARKWWWGGQVMGVILPLISGIAILAGWVDLRWPAALGGLAALAGLWCADDAYVRAGQSVPLS